MKNENAIAKTASADIDLAREQIERRIAVHLQETYHNFLEVGRCLCRAKDEKLVPHGEWEDWVRKHAGMSERQAQKLMQAARNVNPDSTLGQLPISQIQVLLALPESEREPMAERVQEESMSLRELQAEVQKYKDAAERATSGEEDANRRAALAEKRAKSRLDEALKAADTVERLRTELAAEKLKAGAAPEGVSPEAQAHIDELNRALDDALAANDAMQDEVAKIKRNGGRASEGLTLDALMQATGTFMGAVGGLPAMLQRSNTAISPADAAALHGQVQMIGDWAQRMLELL